MLNSKKIRLAIRKPLLDAEIIDEDNIAWEGRSFDPSGKCIWIRETLLPATEIPSAQETPEFVGIMQYDIFVREATGTETVEDMAETLGDLYDPDNPHVERDGIKIIFDRCERLRMDKDGTWQWIPVQVYFRAVE